MRFEALRARGGELVVIDPRRSETAAIADWHLFIRPGTDAFLLFALVNLLFAGDRVEPGHLAGRIDGLERLRELAAPFTPEAVARHHRRRARRTSAACASASARPNAPVIYGRIGLCTQEFGTLASWLVDVVNLLRGRLDAEGGAMFPRPATGQGEDSDSVGELLRGRWHSKVRGFPEYMSMLPATLMAEELAWDGEDRARALITVAGNPVLSVPNGDRLREAIDGLDFVVALDIYINETTSRADVILPSTVQLEHSNYDFLFQSTSVRNFARYSPQVLAPEPGARDQWQLLLEICGRVNGLTVEQLDAMIFDGLAERVGARLPEVGAERVKELAGTEPGPERLLDMMLRAGPYGDGFDGGEGLTLARVKAAEHGIDLGPLTPGRLPGILRTEGKRIRLLHPLLEEDLGRLHDTAARRAAAGAAADRAAPHPRHELLAAQPAALRARQEPLHAAHAPRDAAARGLADGAIGDRALRGGRARGAASSSATR